MEPDDDGSGGARPVGAGDELAAGVADERVAAFQGALGIVGREREREPLEVLAPARHPVAVVRSSQPARSASWPVARSSCAPPRPAWRSRTSAAVRVRSVASATPRRALARSSRRCWCSRARWRASCWTGARRISRSTARFQQRAPAMPGEGRGGGEDAGPGGGDVDADRASAAWVGVEHATAATSSIGVRRADGRPTRSPARGASRPSGIATRR